ncbi:MAG: hypothetical protein GY855_02750 [candidate division Zixibacteria bacterium]|nr:hypothetical protein [candidate division Zixibacteria bacterium]
MQNVPNSKILSESCKIINIPIKHFVIYLSLMAATGIICNLYWSGAPYISPDSKAYLEVVEDLKDGSLDTFHERVIGYPLIIILSTIGTIPLKSVFYLQLLMHFCSVFLILSILYRFSIPFVLSLVFTIVLLLPHSVAYSAHLVTEIPTQFFLALFIAGFIYWVLDGKYSMLLVSSISLGYCIITKPTFQLLPFFLGIFLFIWIMIFSISGIHRNRLRTAGIMMIIIPGIIIGSLIIHNHIKFNHAKLSALDIGMELTLRTADYIEDLPEDYSEIQDILIYHRDKMLYQTGSKYDAMNYIWNAIPEIEERTGMDKGEIGDELLKINLYLIYTHPLKFGGTVFKSLISFWKPIKGTGYIPHIFDITNSILHIFVLSVLIAFTVMISLSLIKCSPEQRKQLLVTTDNNRLMPLIISIIIFILLYTWIVSSTIGLGLPRYRFPVDILILFMIILEYDILKRFRRIIKTLPH